MKFKRTLVLMLLILLNIAATVSTSTKVAFASDRSKTSIQESNEVFLDPKLQELLSTSTEETLEKLIVVFDSKIDVSQKMQPLLSLNGVKVTQVFKIIPGVAASAPLSLIEKIRRFEGVKAVWLDHKVETLDGSDQIVFGREVSPMLSESTRLINAPSLWNLGFNGSGKVIAVVDTGVNWYHESLDDLDDNLATIDPKVIANVSFVTEPTPAPTTGFDDHGHGTHVAGIAAGTGGPSHLYMGVAPGAQLYAVKVLNLWGWGYWSWVVSGIDWSVENHADIITMSLGGWGYPYDPVSMASDAAVDAGIIVTVAAGNSGYYGTISSPGLAKKVITVGASTKGDTIAQFSSRGPNGFDYRGDPDVIAPGVGIMSADAFNINGYVAYSGTSMATPHVAGGVALLLQAFSDATPALIQSALMVSAVDVASDSYKQGAGRIDVLGAYNTILEANNMGFLSSKTMSLSTPTTSTGEVSPQYAWFSNSRLQFWVDDFGNIVDVYFDNTWSVYVIAWRIAYNSSNFASWVDLETIQPMMNTIWNETYRQAFGAFRTPDKAAAIFVMIELFGNETWARTSFMVWPMRTTLENLRIFSVEDSAMNSTFSDDWAQYYASHDIIVVNDTKEAAPPKHFGFGGVLPSSAHHVGPYPEAWYAAYYDKLNNNGTYIGDDNNAFRWTLGNVKTPVIIPVVFGFEYDVSTTFDVINEGRAKPPTPFNIVPYPELSVSLSGPTMAKSNTPATYTATVTNYWIGDSTNAVLTFYVDGASVGSTVINVPSGASIKVSKSISMTKGLHQVEAKVVDVNDLVLKNNVAKKKVFVDIMFSAVLPGELEVNTYSDFGPFSWNWMAWVNLTILTPVKMSNLEILLTGNLSRVVSFVDSPKIGDIEGWAYFAFEVYASGAPYQVYSGSIRILSMGNTVNEIPIIVKVWWNPVPKVNSVSLNDTTVLRVTETLGVTINVTDMDTYGYPVVPSTIPVNVYLLYFDINWGGWFIMEGPIPATYDATTGLYKFTRVFPKDAPIGMFGIGVEAIDPQYNWTQVRTMPRPFYVANNIPLVHITLSPKIIAKNEMVFVNVTASDVETPAASLSVTATIITPTGRIIQVEFTRTEDEFAATFSDTSEEGRYLLVILVTDSDGAFTASAQTFNVDSTAPTIRIVSPKDGAFISRTVEIVFTVLDENLKNASISIDQGPPQNVTEATSFLLDTTTLTDGTHTIKLSAFDKAENKAENSITITVDNTVPSAKFTSPAGESRVAGTVHVTFSFSDLTLDKATLTIDGKPLADITENTSYDWDTSNVVDGEHILALKVLDKAGNVKEKTLTIVVDNTKPFVEIASPANGTELIGTVTIRFIALDTNMEKVILYIDDAQFDVTGTTSYDWDTTKVSDGTHTLRIVALDVTGNTKDAQIIVAIKNVQKGIERSLGLIGLVVAALIGVAFSVPITYIIAKRRAKKP